MAAAAVLLLAGPVGAIAAPAPDHGPTAGGVRVSGAVPDPVTFTAVANGAMHSVAIGSDGQTYAWGNNLMGQLGEGTTANSLVPVPVRAPAGVTFTAVTAGDFHALAIGSDGLTYAWGRGVQGQLGTGTTANSPVPVPVLAPAGVTFTAVSAGNEFSLAIGSDGQAYAWGYGFRGQLGTGTTADSSVPVPVLAPAGVTFTAVSAGGEFALAIGSDGLTYAWGRGTDGQLGTGTAAGSSVPVPVLAPAGVTFTAVSAGREFSLAIGSDGRAYAWGRGASGQLGTGTTADSSVPVPVIAPAGVRLAAVSSGYEFSSAIGSDGLTYAWGNGNRGQLGTGTTAGSSVPVPVGAPAGVTFTAVSARVAHTVAIGSDGLTYTWGRGAEGQLGTGGTADSLVPGAIDPVAVVDSVAFGGVAGVDLTHDGTTWTVTTPAHPCGPVDVAVTYTQFAQTRSRTTPGGFTYGTAPVITSNPDDVFVPSPGGQVTLTAAADGDDTPSVQWQRAALDSDDWTDIPDATSTTASLEVTSAAHYRAAFTNCLGTATTTTATVTLADAGIPAPTAPAPTAPAPATPDPTPTQEPASGAGDRLHVDGEASRADSAPNSLARTGTTAGAAAALALALSAAGVAIITRAHLRRRAGDSSVR